MKVNCVRLAGLFMLATWSIFEIAIAQQHCRPSNGQDCSGISLTRCQNGMPTCQVACRWEVTKAGNIDDNQNCKTELFSAENALCTGASKPAQRFSTCRLVGFGTTTQLFSCCERISCPGVPDPAGGVCDEGEMLDCGFTGSDPLCFCLPTPILISLRGNSIQLSSSAEGVAFDLDADGAQEWIPWTKAGTDDAFLVMDRNLNGRIDDGTELFGNFTPQPESDDRNGFEALKVFDGEGAGGNGDGLISRGDWVYGRLKLWTDRNRDGVSQSGELLGLERAGILSLDLDYRLSRRRDRHGNLFKYIAPIWMDPEQRGPRRKWAVDVVFRLPVGQPAAAQGASLERSVGQ